MEEEKLLFLLKLIIRAILKLNLKMTLNLMLIFILMISAVGVRAEHMPENFGEIEKMLGINMSEFDFNKEFKPATSLRVFVSSSMGTGLLKQYIHQAKIYGAILVFNGLPDGSWMNLANIVYDITEDGEEGVSIQIDNLAFEEYGIRAVPSFVLSREENNIFDSGKDGKGGEGVKGANKRAFDIVRGNIGIRRALEEFVDNGELKEEAEKLLARIVNGN